MITLQELNPKGFATTAEQATNLSELLKRMNILRAAYGKPMSVTSGFRSLEDHRRIYMQLAAQRGITSIRIPMGSMHLKGAAADISDKDGSLYNWCKANEQTLVSAGLWCEEKDDQARVHFQIFPPKSGNRWFKP